MGGDSAAALFSATLQWKPSGEGSIALAGRKLGDAGAQAWASWALARKKRKGERLRTADFSDNGLTDVGFQCIVAALIKLWPETRVLKAFKNRISTDKASAEIIRLGNLTELHLSHNAVTAQSIASLVSTAVASGYPRHGDTPLWLRLEQNVREGDAALARHLQPLLKDICAVDGLTSCNPAACAQRPRKPPAVHLPYIAAGERGGGSPPAKAPGAPCAAWRACAPCPRPSTGWAQTSASQAPPVSASEADFPRLQARAPTEGLPPRPLTAWTTRRAAKARPENAGREANEEGAKTDARPETAGREAAREEAAGREAAREERARPEAAGREAAREEGARPETAGREGASEQGGGSGPDDDNLGRLASIAGGEAKEPSAPKAIARGTHVRITAAYASEGGGYLTVSAGQVAVLGSAFPEAGYARDAWPEYVYVSTAEEGGWVPWALCRPLERIQ
jgi:hypothetical protein